MARAKAGPVVTDNANFIIDAPFTEAALRKPREVPFMSLHLSLSTDMPSASREHQATYWGCRSWYF